MNDGPLNELTETDMSGNNSTVEKLVQQPRIWLLVRAGLIVLTLVAMGLLIEHPLFANLVPTVARQSITQTPTGTSLLQIPISIQTNVSNGKLKIDGIDVSTSPNTFDHPLILRKIRTSVEIIAPPYNPIICAINALNLSSDQVSDNTAASRCKLIGITNSFTSGIATGDVIIISMDFTTDDLPPTERQQLFDEVPVALGQLTNSSLHVLSQTHYATGDGGTYPIASLATSSLQARLSVQINDVAIPATSCQQLLCAPYATIGSFTKQIAYSTYELPVHFMWQFFQSSGQSETNFPIRPIPGTGPQTDQITLHFSYIAGAGWHVIDTGMPYDSTQQQINTLLCNQAKKQIIPLFQGSSASDVIQSPIVNGCLFIMQPSTIGVGSQINTTDPIHDNLNAWFMVHFGAVLAVSDPAHALIPELERATPEEVNEILAAQHN